MGGFLVWEVEDADIPSRFTLWGEFDRFSGSGRANWYGGSVELTIIGLRSNRRVKQKCTSSVDDKRGNMFEQII